MTAVPIDYRNRPWRQKYIDEETYLLNRWFIFGLFPNGTVGICDGDNDIMEHVPMEIAERIIRARNEFVDKMIAELCST